MQTSNSLSDVLRFVQLRPPRPPEESGAIGLLEAEVARGLAGAGRAARRRLGLASLEDRSETISNISDLKQADEVAVLLDAVRGGYALSETESTAVKALGADSPDADDDVRRLANTLAASMAAGVEPESDIRAIEDAYRFYAFARADGPADDDEVKRWLHRPLVIDALGSSKRLRAKEDDGGHASGPATDEAVAARGAEAAAHESQGRVNPRALAAVLDEVSGLDRPGSVVEPENGRADTGPVPFTLTATARERLSEPARSLLHNLGIDLTLTPVHALYSILSGIAVSGVVGQVDGVAPVIDLPTSQPGPGPGLPPAPAVRAAGVADLLVVKQQIKAYEAGEIAHIENVLAGETKTRTHRALDRTEETFTSESETTREQERELETAERFELNREASRTIKDDQKIGFGLSVSGKYGPTVEFSSNLTMDRATASEETSRSASRFAKDVVQRSLERVTERLREERIRRIIRETEETNVHSLTNETGTHRAGVYQFLDKLYEAQVFNYGIREMFDFMVPEPASFLWHAAGHPSAGITLPDPPEPLAIAAPDARYVNLWNYRTLAARYRAGDVVAPPPLYQTVTGLAQHGQDDASESGQPRSQTKIELAVPDGYEPWRATVAGLALTDENPVIGVTLGDRNRVWNPTQADRIDLGGSWRLAYRPALYADFSTVAQDPTTDSKFPVTIVAYETNTYTLTVVLTCRRTDDAYAAWQLKTYAAIRDAYEDRLREHQAKVAELQAKADERARAIMPFGAPPARNAQLIRQELRKHCISILTRQYYDSLDATQDGDPPQFDFDEAEEEGAFVRFFEHAFEWDQLQYVSYPYFWARKTTWIDRFLKDDVDPEFADFWRAGSARVVVPVRPGFEKPVTYFLETGLLWGGAGEPPDINSPDYVSIVDEIRERTGASQGELPVGEPWEVRVPTPLALVRNSSELPTWVRADPATWDWDPAPAAAPGDN